MPVEEVTPLLTVEELRSRLGVAPDETLDESRLTELLKQATADIVGACGRTFGIVNVTDELHDGDGTDTLELDITPIVEVGALSIDGQAVGLSELAIYPCLIAFKESGEYNPRLRSYGRIFPIGRQNVKVSYRAGYAAVPREIADACAIQVGFLMNTYAKQGIASETSQVGQNATTYSHRKLAPSVQTTCARYSGKTRFKAI